MDTGQHCGRTGEQRSMVKNQENGRSNIRTTGGPWSEQDQENGWAMVQDQGEREAHGPRSGEREAHGPRSGERRPMIQDQEKGRSMI